MTAPVTPEENAHNIITEPVRYRDDTIHERIGTIAGRPAESAFIAAMAKRGYNIGEKLFRFGFEQVPTKFGVAATFPSWVLHAPDYIQVGGHMWEVQGCGHDGIVRFKREKLTTLWEDWHVRLGGNRQVQFAVYSMRDEVVYLLTFDMVLWAIDQPESRYLEQLVDAKDGWEVPLELFDRRLVTDISIARRLSQGAVDEQ
jgi:hypothetical protein